MSQSCVICGSNLVKHFKTIDSFPAIVFPVNREDKDVVDTKSITTYHCLSCHHIFQTEIDENFLKKIYSKYYTHYPYSNLELLNDAYRYPFAQLVNSVELDGKRSLLEIGTSDPTHLEPFLEMGIECVAINPGAQNHNIIRFIDAFYEEYDLDQKFEIIVARFVLEHVVDLNLFINRIKNDLVEGGIVLIQVPDTFAMIRDGTLNFLAHEHTQYFTRHSIRTLFLQNNFCVLRENENTEASIIMAFEYVGLEKNIYKNINGEENISFDQYLENISKIKESINQKFGHEKDLVFYGAGMILTELLYNSHYSEYFRNVATIFDDNYLVQSKYMPKTRNPISNILDSGVRKNTHILLTCRKIYEHKIIPKLVSHISLNQIFVVRANSIISLNELRKND